MNVTIIKCETPDILYYNTVRHECTCGQFLQDIKDEVKRYLLGHKDAKQIDIFWHLDEYLDEKYGACYWQMVSIETLVQFIQ